MARKNTAAPARSKAADGEADAVKMDAGKAGLPAAEPVAEPAPPPVPAPRQIDPNQIVTVRNGFQGRLIYQSKRTGELFVWDAFGDEQDMELSELKNARNSCKKFFINNWFMFDEPWIVDYLGVAKFYKFAVSVEAFDGLFEKGADEIAGIIETLSDGQKRSVAYRARQLITEGQIDSNRVIASLEKSLGIGLLDS